jgi:hypothetical protein
MYREDRCRDGGINAFDGVESVDCCFTAMASGRPY